MGLRSPKDDDARIDPTCEGSFQVGQTVASGDAAGGPGPWELRPLEMA